MTVPVHDVAAELRARRPGLGIKQLHKLLYFCQGHHLADLGESLFAETISAWDMGPVVGSFWRMEERHAEPNNHATLDNAALNTVGYVISRYGRLSGDDLENLTHAQRPWQRADQIRQATGQKSVRIDPEWIEEHFRAARERELAEIGLDRRELAALLAGAHERRAGAGDEKPDDLESIRELLAAAGG